MKFTKVPTDVFSTMQINAGVLLDTFTPSSPAITLSNIIGATDGGINASCVPEFADLADGIDNVAKNCKDLKYIKSYECKLAGTFKTITPALAKMLIGAADTTTASGLNTITPRMNLEAADFKDIWFVGDYSNKNGETNGGFIAIHLSNALNTAGFNLQTTKDDRGTFSAEFVGHCALNSDVVPFEIYIKSGSDESAG